MNFLFLLFIFSLVIGTARAHCPLCTAAVGTAALSATYFGFDASMVGVFVGAFAVSTGMMFGGSLKKEYIKFQLPVIVIASFLLTLIPIMNVVEDYMVLILDKPYIINKLLFGGLLGGIAVPSSYSFHKFVKKKRGKVLFPYQGVAFTLIFLLIISFALYFVV